MKEQLRLLNPSNPQWRLDERTCERGRAGISKSREALARAGESRLGESRLGESRMGESRLGESRLGESRMGVSRSESQHSTAA